MSTWENTSQNGEKATQNTVKQSLKNDCQQINISKKAHMLVSPVLPKYSVNLIIPIVFLRNSVHKVLNWCEDVSEEYQKQSFVRQCPAQSAKAHKNSQNHK
jgi:hypothetical protein